MPSWVFSEWPADGDKLPPREVIKMYRRKFAGAIDQPEEKEALRAEQDSAADVAATYGFAELGKDKLSIPFICVMKRVPVAWPGPAQTTGDCVSRNVVNAALTTLYTEIEAGIPDEVSGVIEGEPDVSDTAKRNTILSCETVYGDRGHSGQGASCARLVRHITSWGGMVLRRNYPDAGVDLTVYDSSIGSRWGRSGTPDYFHRIGKQHQIRRSAECNSFEEVRDFIAAGYGISTCGSEGYTSTRDENGVSRRRGSWAHAMAYIGVDDRPSIKSIYGEPLVLILNSWGVWNSGPRRIRGTDIDIPKGSSWVRWSDCRNRYCQALSGAQGWKSKSITWSFSDELWG